MPAMMRKRIIGWLVLFPVAELPTGHKPGGGEENISSLRQGNICDRLRARYLLDYRDLTPQNRRNLRVQAIGIRFAL